MKKILITSLSLIIPFLSYGNTNEETSYSLLHKKGASCASPYGQKSVKVFIHPGVPFSVSYNERGAEETLSREPSCTFVSSINTLECDLYQFGGLTIDLSTFERDTAYDSFVFVGYGIVEKVNSRIKLDCTISE